MKKTSRILKILIICAALFGMTLAFVNAKTDGYSHWLTRLLYFTNQSNIWIAATAAGLLVLDFSGAKKSEKAYRLFYSLKFVFTVAISITALIFFVVLAPGAANENYRAFTLSSIMVHAVTPALAILDFFIERDETVFSRKEVFYSVIPPVYYLVFCIVLYLFEVDFGRGDNFPYFFLNFGSPAGIFGTSSEAPYIIGSFYWMAFILFLVLGLAYVYFILHPATRRVRKEAKRGGKHPISGKTK